MNNWYLKFIVFGFLAFGVGLVAAWIVSLFCQNPDIQKGIGFLVSGLAIIAADFTIRRRFDDKGIYQEIYLMPFFPIQIPVWVFGILIAIGGIVILCSGD